eukprot:EG_transcript_37270
MLCPPHRLPCGALLPMLRLRWPAAHPRPYRWAGLACLAVAKVHRLGSPRWRAAGRRPFATQPGPLPEPSTGEPAPPPKAPSLWQRYGKTGVAVYLAVYVVTFTSCFLLVQGGLLHEEHVEAVSSFLRLDKILSAEQQKGAGAFAMAFLMTKLLGPVRWGIVLTVAPLIVRSTNA